LYGWKVGWNRQPKDTYAYLTSGDDHSQPFYNTDLETQTDLDSYLCDNTWAKYQTIDAYIDYTEGMSEWILFEGDTKIFDYADYVLDWNSNEFPLLGLKNSDSVVGVALNGVFLFAGTSEYGYDAFFPKAYGNMKNP
jgi:hypothetical protein